MSRVQAVRTLSSLRSRRRLAVTRTSSAGRAQQRHRQLTSWPTTRWGYRARSSVSESVQRAAEIGKDGEDAVTRPELPAQHSNPLDLNGSTGFVD
jgi:hypothetical protein